MMGPFDDDLDKREQEYYASRCYPEEYDSIEEYELQHGTYGSEKDYDFDDDDEDDDY